MNRILIAMLYAALAVFASDLYAQEKETVAVIGTGDMGDSLGPRFARLGYRVVYGSRDPGSDKVKALVAKTGDNASATTQQEAAQQVEKAVFIDSFVIRQLNGSKVELKNHVNLSTLMIDVANAEYNSTVKGIVWTTNGDGTVLLHQPVGAAQVVVNRYDRNGSGQLEREEWQRIEGTIKRNNPIRVLRDSVVIYEGSLESLRRFKDDVLEVRQNIECGIGVKNYNDVKAGDQIEVYETIEVQRSLS